jgi:hypothetical protein
MLLWSLACSPRHPCGPWLQAALLEAHQLLDTVGRPARMGGAAATDGQWQDGALRGDVLAWLHGDELQRSGFVHLLALLQLMEALVPQLGRAGYAEVDRRGTSCGTLREVRGPGMREQL